MKSNRQFEKVNLQKNFIPINLTREYNTYKYNKIKTQVY